MCLDREVPRPIERNRRTGGFISACATVLMVCSDMEVSRPIGRNRRTGGYILACATVLVMCLGREVWDQRILTWGSRQTWWFLGLYATVLIVFGQRGFVTDIRKSMDLIMPIGPIPQSQWWIQEASNLDNYLDNWKSVLDKLQELTKIFKKIGWFFFT